FLRILSNRSCGALVKTISILGVQDFELLTGAPAAVPMAFTRAVTKAVNCGGWPTATGHISLSQRAIFPVSLTGTVKALANFSSVSRDAVMVRFSCGGACADAADSIIVPLTASAPSAILGMTTDPRRTEILARPEGGVKAVRLTI